MCVWLCMYTYLYWISRGLGVLGFLGYIGFQSQNASFRATCAQKGRQEKCWMLWFSLNQWSTGPTGVPEKLKQSETVGNSWKQSETVGNSRKQSGAARRDHAKIVNPPFFCKKKLSAQSHFFFESATGNSWKQLGRVPLTRQKKSYLKPFKAHFLYKLVLNSSFLPSQRYAPQLFPTVSRCTFKKKMGLRGNLFFAKEWRVDDFGMITPGRSRPDCFRLFPTVSVSLERQLDLWTTDSTKITTFNTFPDDPSARRLLEMMHFDFETQYTLKIPKPQDLVKFNIHIHTSNVFVYIYLRASCANQYTFCMSLNINQCSAMCLLGSFEPMNSDAGSPDGQRNSTSKEQWTKDAHVKPAGHTPWQFNTARGNRSPISRPWLP